MVAVLVTVLALLPPTHKMRMVVGLFTITVLRLNGRLVAHNLTHIFLSVAVLFVTPLMQAMPQLISIHGIIFQTIIFGAGRVNVLAVIQHTFMLFVVLLVVMRRNKFKDTLHHKLTSFDNLVALGK